MTSVIRYKRDLRIFSQEATAYSEHLTIAKLNELSEDFQAAELSYREAAKKASMVGATALANEFYSKASDMRSKALEFNLADID